jgi:hypothetical protein
VLERVIQAAAAAEYHDKTIVPLVRAQNGTRRDGLYLREPFFGHFQGPIEILHLVARVLFIMGIIVD